MADPWGRSCLVFPRFFSFVHDSPEAMDMLCVRGGSKRCAFPCTRCKVPGQELHNLDSTYEVRTETHQQAVFGRLADASLTATARSQLSQDELIKPLLVRQHGAVGAGRLLAELNRRSAEVPRAHDFQIPSPGSYFTGKGVCVPLHHFTP
ncbi:gag_pre-integrs domain-containing protein [Haematococcus lacustris]|uniref:Gag_pre-integrs domain-containing protein n=1 Tax=Haematococcus lacustris TaxID=44745 RepID=A0A6A0AF88_HAELA|nr:gag_pre-integrs domain-containing protein [Haematococcus lacustris]